MLTKTKKLLSLVLAIVMILTAFPSVSFAADPPSSADQITGQGETRYYDETGSEVTGSPVLGGNAVVSVAKTLEGTDVENEFTVNLEVKTPVDISNVNLSSDSAVVLVLDISYSMVNYGRTWLKELKAAACEFLDNYVAEAGGAVRYAALVSFNSVATIQTAWVDVTNSTNLTRMKDKIQGLKATFANSGTFMQGGLTFARNLLRTEALPSGTGGETIGNRSVILFSDGMANEYKNSTTIGSSTGTTFTKNASGVAAAQNYAKTVADVIKDETSFTLTNGKTYDKYTANLYTIAYSDLAPAEWLRDNIATDASHAFSASNLSGLNDAFGAISNSIESWTEAWTVTDPMGTNIELITDVTQDGLGLENDTIIWDLKQASPTFVDDIYTYNYSYRIKLDTASASFAAGTPYPTNGETKLTYVMVENGEITSNVMTAIFSVPEVEGYAGSLDFTKVGGDTVPLAGCEFALTHQNKASHYFTAESEAVTGKVGFANIPSGHTYSLEETSMPDEYEGTYLQSTETYTVTVSFGSVIIKDSKGNDVTVGFEFNNPSVEPEKSEAPVINQVMEGDAVITGTGIAGSEITVTLPNGTTVSATVSSGGTWTANVPSGVVLSAGEIISAVQQETGKTVSDAVNTTVVGNPEVEPGVDVYAENLTTGEDYAKAGDTLLYDVIITNNGTTSSTWESAYVTFDLNRSVALRVNSIRIDNRPVASSQYEYDSGANTLTLYLGDLVGGNGVSISFRVTVSSDISNINEMVLEATLGSLVRRSIIYQW